MVHVPDASRAVGVAQSLLSADNKAGYIVDVKDEYERIRVERAKHGKVHKTLEIDKARANRVPIEWADYTPDQPKFLGLKTFDDYNLNDLVERIDWTPFFSAWELAGRYPRILEDKVIGEEAKKLYADGKAMLLSLIHI